MLRFTTALVIAAVCLPLLQAATVFSTDFESGLPPQFSGAGGIEGTAGYAAYGFGALLLRNATVAPPVPSVLTLTGLPAHTSLDLTLLLAIIDSWDGSTGGFSPDLFNVTVDGVSVFSYTFDNFSLADQSYPGPFLVRGPNLGWNSWGDAAYAISLSSIAHTGSTATIRFFAGGGGWQGGADESWGIDNVSVSVSGGSPGGIPEPASLLLVAGGLGTLLLRRRR